MLIVRSRNGVLVRLTEERWQHIVHRHPEMDDQRERVLETLAGPDLVQRGDFGALLAVKFYPETPMSEKFLVVAYREVSAEDGFILTAYLTHRPEGRLHGGGNKDSGETRGSELGLRRGGRCSLPLRG